MKLETINFEGMKLIRKIDNRHVEQYKKSFISSYYKYKYISS
jgi:hypothetical protein